MNPSRLLHTVPVLVLALVPIDCLKIEGSPFPTPAFVQQNYGVPQAPAIKISAPYLQAQTGSNVNILAIGWNDTFAAIQSVTDSVGNSYQEAVPTFQGNGMSQAIYYADDIRPGANTVTVTFSQPAAFIDLRITEYSGLSVNGFDAGSSATGLSSNADSGPVSISTTNELIFGAGMTATSFTSGGPGFAVRAITPDGDIVEDQVASGSGLYHGLATLNSGAWLMQVAAFKPLTPPAPPRLTILLTSTNTLLLTWPTTPNGFNLQHSSQLITPNWANVPNPVNVVGTQNEVIVPLSGSQQYYRLKNP